MSPVVGSIIEGTLRPQDLIPKFLATLQEYNPQLWVTWTTPNTEEYLLLPEEDDDTWWSSGDASEVLHDLSDALDDIAPHGCYFGPHSGNNSDFGFWPL